jgi:hypothetical protein
MMWRRARLLGGAGAGTAGLWIGQGQGDWGEQGTQGAAQIKIMSTLTVGILQYNPIQLQKSGQSDFAK